MAHERRRLAAIQICSGVVGVVVLLVGIAGFVPGVTTNLDTLRWAGPESHAMLFGLLQVSILANVVNLIFGVAGLLCALRPRASRLYLFWGGVLEFAIWAYAVWAWVDPGANVLPVNVWGVVALFVVSVVMILLGLFVGRDASRRSVGSQPVEKRS